MIKSMTGYGQAEVKEETKSCRVEIRSVNHRYLDLSLKPPKNLNRLEDKIKKIVKSEIKRGYVEIFIKLEKNSPAPKNITPNLELVRKIVSGLRKIQTELNLSGKIDMKSILALAYRDIFKLEEAEEKNDPTEWKLIEQTLKSALLNLQHMRQQEGKMLFADLKNRIKTIKKYCAEIEGRIPENRDEYRLRLNERTKALLEEEGIDNLRIAQEIALFAERSDISEELTRLESHTGQFLETLQLDEPIGRKLEFIQQEINREVNTIGSKANDYQISQKVISLKCEIEKIREQLQNIE